MKRKEVAKAAKEAAAEKRKTKIPKHIKKRAVSSCKAEMIERAVEKCDINCTSVVLLTLHFHQFFFSVVKRTS